MQAVYFIALFGLVFAVISSFTVGIGANSMQVKASKLEQMQQTFDNLEFAINNIYLKERLDLSDLPLSEGSAVSLSGESLKVFLPYMRGSEADLVQDPWRTALNYYGLQFPEVLCQSAAPPSGTEPTNDCLVRAPTAYLVMVSAGPNRKFESGADNNGGMPAGNALAFLNYPKKGDDIVKVFSTSAPMRAHYNNMIAVEDRVSALVLKSYRDQSAAFFQTKDVKDYIEARLTQALGNGGFFPDDGGIVSEPGGGSGKPPCTGKECPPEPCPVGTQGCFPIDITREQIYGDILTSTEARTWRGYPRMNGTAGDDFEPNTSYPIPADAYGAQSELQYDPFCVASSGDTRPGTSNCTPVTINYDEAKPWRATITRDIIIPRGWFISTLRTLDGKEDL